MAWNLNDSLDQVADGTHGVLKDRCGRIASLASRSAGSLHAKTFAVDGRRVFIGSFNFDPRSANLNTELGFVIESPHLARRIEETFDTEIPANSYRVRRDGKGRMSWLETREG